jgi:hypothetical protein
LQIGFGSAVERIRATETGQHQATEEHDADYDWQIPPRISI